MVAKVCSWCGSSVGASAAMAARSTPPRRGVSAFWASALAATSATQTATIASAERRRLRYPISVLRQPDVLELLVREVTGGRDVVLHLRPVHDVSRPPETREDVGVVEQDLLDLDDQLPALDRVEGPGLPREQVF